MSLPSKVGLPAEMQPQLDYSLPANARSYAVRVQPTNVSSVAQSGLSTTTTAGVIALAFPQTDIYFDLPTSQSPSTFLDTRMTQLNFKATITVQTSGATGSVTSGHLRAGASSWFDMMSIVGGDGSILEQINEYGLCADTVSSLTMSQSGRDGTALPLGFLSGTSNENQGHAWEIFNSRLPLDTNQENHSYSIPIMSGLIGAASDKFLNIGRVGKLQLKLQTASVAPITLINAITGTAAVFTVTLSDFQLGLEYCDIGSEALAMIDNSLIDGKFYSHGMTYKTSSTVLPATSGTVSLLSGLRGSSLKSMITRFQENALTTAGGCNGKYDSKCPSINSFNYSVGGVKYPQSSVNCLTQPALAFSNTLMAVGSFNNAVYQASIVPSQYCVLSAGGTAQSLTNTNGSDHNWAVSATAGTKCAQFFFGQNLERCARKGLFSGIDIVSAPVFIELGIATAPTNTHNVYNIGMFDAVYIHDVQSGLIQVRM